MGKTEAGKRWAREHISRLSYDERKETAAAFREKCRRESAAQSAIPRKAVLDFLGEEGGNG